MYNISVDANAGSSLRGWMQSTGQTSTQALSFVPTHGSQMIYATRGRQYNSRTLGTTAVLLLLSGVLSAQLGEPWRESPAFVTLFAPAGPRAGAYTAYVSSLDLDATLSRLAGDATLMRTPGAWEPRTLAPTDAFGQSGRYDRSKLARLYGGRAPRVARGSRARDGRATETWTLISPYPDTDLQKLDAGTLLLVLRLP